MMRKIQITKALVGGPIRGGVQHLKLLARRRTRSKHAQHVSLRGCDWDRVKLLYRVLEVGDSCLPMDVWVWGEFGAYADRTQTDMLR